MICARADPVKSTFYLKLVILRSTTRDYLDKHNRTASYRTSPATMQSYHVTTYSKPSGYQLSELPKPAIEDEHDVIIKVHAGSVNPVDVKMASGILKQVTPLEYGSSPCPFLKT